MSAVNSSSAPLLPVWLWVALITVISVVLIPLFVCAPVTSDTSLFDVQALTAMRGGVLYRDIVEPNLPGVVWVHMAVRPVIGWSSEAMRTFDLAVFVLTASLLCGFVRCATDRRSNATAGGLFFVLALFYLTRNEWCHCQRDSWLLLPVCAALWLRRQRCDLALPPYLSAMAEGAFWGIAFWIKPHVAIPALAVMAVARVRHANSTTWLRDCGWVVVGGLAAAIPGIVWLIVNGAWPHFWEMMLEWNPDYLEAGRERRSLHRLTLMFRRFSPWWAVHLAAIPLALRALHDSWHSRSDDHTRSMLAGVYLAWLVQSFWLQHAMDYIHVPEIMLAIVVIARHPWQIEASTRRVMVVASLLLAAVVAAPLQPQRLALWAECLQRGSTPEIRAGLAQGNFPDWVALEDVRAFLQQQNVADRDVTCFNVHSIHLHQELGVLPATRYWTVLTPLTMFPRRFDQIMRTIESSGHRFVVLEERETSHDGQVRPDRFPRDYPVVFSAGSYKVYAVSGSTVADRFPEIQGSDGAGGAASAAGDVIAVGGSSRPAAPRQTSGHFQSATRSDRLDVAGQR